MGLKIKKARKSERMTLEVLSERLEISRNFLWEIESGRKAPAINTLYKISKELNVSVDYLFGLSQEVRRIDETKENKVYKIYDMVGGMNKNEINMLYHLLRTYYDKKA